MSALTNLPGFIPMSLDPMRAAGTAMAYSTTGVMDASTERSGKRSPGFIGLSDIAAPPTPLIKISGRASMREAPDTFRAVGEVYESPEQVRASVNSRTIAMLMLV